jgi:hypothetical protein
VFHLQGSFSTIINGIESDLRSLYCAFVICHLLDDWSGVDVDSALAYIASCRVSFSYLCSVMTLIIHASLMKEDMASPLMENHSVGFVRALDLSMLIDL